MTCHVARSTGFDEARLDRVVRAGGGEYVGLQPVRNRGPLVLFNDPRTGTTLSVPLSGCSVEAVRGRIMESRRIQ